MEMLCQYKNIFGEPNKGFHSYRLGGLAIGDVIGTLLINWLIAYSYDLDFFTTLVWVMLVTILIHYLFCVPTALNVALGLAEPSSSS